MSGREAWLKAFGLMEPRDKLVRVRSWLPTWDGRYVCWPILLIDAYGYRRTGSAPCWDRARLRDVIARFIDGSKP